MVGHYPLDVLDRAPKVRIHHVAAALARIVDLDVIADTRARRAPRLRAYVAAGGLAGLTGVYVESASSTMTPVDWWSSARCGHTACPWPSSFGTGTSAFPACILPVP